MATLDGTNALSGLDLANFDTYRFVGQNLLGQNSSTQYAWLTAAGHAFQATGENIVVDMTGNAIGGNVGQIDIDLGNNGSVDIVITGVAASFPALIENAPVFDEPLFMQQVFGGDDILDGTAFNDTLLGDASQFKGAGGSDFIDGRDGDDLIEGRGGDDVLVGGNGADTLFGGDGDDFLRESNGAPETGADIIEGGFGNDYVLVRSGFGVGPTDIDTFRGGDGIDTIDWSQSAVAGAVFNLATGSAGTEVMVEFENLIGSNGADQIIGSDEANALDGRFGDDTIFGGLGDDTLEGGEGGDSLNGGDGYDVATYLNSGAAIRVALWSPGLNTGDALGDTVQFTVEAVEGSAFNNNIQGNSNNNDLRGAGGDDLVLGGFGDDILEGGAGADDLGGGAGFDTATYRNALGGVRVVLSNPALNEGDAVGDNIRADVEAVEGSAFADSLQGNAVNNTFRGNDGADTILGAFGNDTVFGDAGDDFLIGGAGADSINGGDGFDIASYAGGAAVRVALWNPALNTGDAAGDIIQFTTEAVEGSAFADNIQGNSNNNELRGGAGNDLILGGFGDDTLVGGSGADDVGGGAGFDIASYRTSASGVRVVLTNTALNIGDAVGDNIRPDVEGIEGSAFNDTLQGNASPNALFGGEGDDSLVGAFGDDTLEGGAGADTFVGGDGIDTVSYTSSSSGIGIFIGSPVFDFGDAVGDVFSGVERFIGTGFNDEFGWVGAGIRFDAGDGDDRLFGDIGDDVLNGDAGFDLLFGGAANDTLSGGGDDDTLDGGAGADNFIGGDGFDMVSYANAATAISLVISNPSVGTGDALGDTIGADIELIGGSSAGDTIDVDGRSVVVDGGAGDDSIFGGAGDDTLRGDLGDDSLSGGGNNDVLVGGAGADTLSGGDGLDRVTYENSFSAIRLVLSNPLLGDGDALGDMINSDVETIEGSDFADTLEGDAGDNLFEGGFDDDSILGGSGNDTLLGQDGADTLNGGDGDDVLQDFGSNGVLTGGAGNDAFRFQLTTLNSATITDFSAGAGVTDRIELSAVGDFDTFAEVIAVAVQVNADVVFDFNGATLTLQNVLLSALVADDFDLSC